MGTLIMTRQINQKRYQVIVINYNTIVYYFISLVFDTIKSKTNKIIKYKTTK